MLLLSKCKQKLSVLRGVCLALALAFSFTSHAQQGPSTLNVSGGLFLPSGLPVTTANVNFRIEIYDKASSCMLYTENHLGVDLSASKGGFALPIGRGTSITNYLESTTALSAKIFENNGFVAGGWANCPSGATMLPGDERTIRVHYDLGGGFVAMSPDVPIASAAYAMVAESVQGKRPTDFINVRDDMTYDLTQGNVENVFSATNYTRLQQLLNPTTAVPFAGQRLSNIADPSGAQDATTKNYSDTKLAGQTIDLVDVAPGFGGGKVLTWDQVAGKWVAMTQTVVGTAGGDLSGTYPNPVVANLAIGTSKLADNAVTSAKISTTGIAPNQLVITDGTTGATLKYATCANNEILKFVTGMGWQCTSAASLSAVLSVNGKSGVVVLNGADLGLGTASMRDVGVAATNVPELDAGGKLDYGVIPNFAGDLSGAFNAAFVSGLQGRPVADTAPNANEVLRWNGTLMRWEPSALVDNVGITSLTGDVSASGTGAVAATITNGVITTPKMFATPGANRLVATDATTGATLVPFVCNLNESLQWTASGWACANPSTAFIGNNVIVDGGNSRGADISIGTTDNYAFNFKTNNTNKMTILPNGNVGIGTTSPASALSVAGSVAATGALAAGTNVTAAGNITSGGNVVSGANISATGNITGSNIYATTSLGVGTTAPARTLEVAGVMRVAPSTLPGTPGAGDLAIDSGAGNSLKYHNGTSWISLAVGGTGDFLANGSVPMTGQFRSITGNAAAPGMSFVGDTDNGIFAPTADNFAISTSGSEKMRILANGNVGIGITSPTSALDVAGAIKGSNEIYSNGGYGLFSNLAAGNNNTAPGVEHFTLRSNNLERVRISGNGNVGIGTSTPSRLLSVNGSINVAPSALPGTPAAGDIAIDSAASNSLKYHNGTSWISLAVGGTGDFLANGSVPMTGQFRSIAGNAAAPGMTFVGDTDNGIFAPATDNFAISTAGSEKVRVLANGFVGVGTSNPQGLFEASGLSAGNVEALNATNTSSLSGSRASLTFRGTANTRMASISHEIEALTSDASLLFSTRQTTGNPSEKMRITSAGNLGIGTTSPSRLLSVNGSINVAPSTLPGTPAAGDIAIDSAASNSLKYHNGTSWISLAVGGTGDFLANGSVPMTGQLRHLAGTAAAPGLTFVGDTDNGIYAPSADNLAIATSGVESLRVLANGNIGVGMSAPAYKLDVAGTLHATGKVDAFNFNAISSGPFSPLSSYNGASNLDEKYWDLFHSGNKFFIRMPNDLYGSATNAMIFDRSGTTLNSVSIPGGRLGIGTTSPSRLLSVNGSINVAPSTLPGTPAAGDIAIDSAASNSLKYHNGTSWISLAVGGTGDFRADGSVPMTGQLRHLAGTAGAPGLTFVGDTDNGIFAPAADNLAFGTSASEKMRILANGNVGIGTSAPAFALEVIGNIRGSSSGLFQGNVYAGSGTVANPAYSFLNSTITGIYMPVTDNLAIGTSGIERMRVLANGNVGIGTSAPGRLLSVNGSINVAPSTLPGTPVAGDIAIDSAASNSLKYHNGTSWISLAVGGTGDFRADGSIPMTGQFRSIAGNATAPGMAFVGDTDNGIFAPTADNFAVSTAGSEKLRVLANGFVGIGMSAPAYNLDVAGRINASTVVSIGSTANAGSVNFRRATGTNTASVGYLNAAENNNFNFANIGGSGFFTWSLASGEAMRMTDTGFVGIGTTSPSRLLSVNGAINVAPSTLPGTPVAGDIAIDSAAANSLKYHNGTSWISLAVGGTGDFRADGSVPMTGQFRSTAGTAAAPGITFVGDTDNGIFRPAADNLAIGTSGSEKLRVLANGNVGIGTTAPIARLHVTGGQIYGAQGVLTNQQYGFGDNSTYILAETTGPTSFLTFDVNNNEAVRVLANGNVGIGTTSASAKLTVAGTTISTGYYADAGSAAGPTYTFLNDQTTGMFRPASNMLGLSTNSIERLRIDQNGNVGIGVTLPNRLLSVNGAINVAPSALPGTPVAGDIAIDSSASNSLKYHNGTSWISLAVGGTGDFRADGTVPMTGQFRSIAGNAAAPGMTFVGDTDNGIFAPATDNLAIGTSGSEKLRVLANGNVGIGVTNPIAKLEVGGNGSFTGSVMGPWGNAGAPAFGTSGGSGFYQPAAGNLSLVTNNVDRVRIDGSGNVGIGTTMPGRLLSVNGAINVAPSTLPGTPVAGDIAIDSAASNSLKYHNGTSWISLAVGGTGDFRADGTIPMTGQFRSTAGTAAAPGMSFVGDTDNGIFAPAADNLAIGTSGSEKMRILANGNVGIGTTSPASALDIGSGVLSVGDGAVGTPSITFGSNSNTGLYKSGANTLAVTTNGVQRLRIDSAGLVMNTGDAPVLKVGTGTAASPNFSFATSNTTGMFAPSTGQLAFSSSGTERVRVDASGNVGIGTTAPGRLLSVNGSINVAPSTLPGTPVAGDIAIDSAASNSLKYHNGSSWISLAVGGTGDFRADGTIPMTGQFRSIAGNAAAPGITFVGDTDNGIFAPNADSIGFTTSGSEKMRMLANGNLGLGTTNPASNIHVVGNIPEIRIQDTANTNYSRFVLENGAGAYSVGADGAAGGGIITGTAPYSMVIGTHGPRPIHLFTQGLVRSTIDMNGNFGIGTTAPSRLLQVAGAMKITPTTNPGTPTAGDIFVDSASSNALKYHNGSNWVSIGSGSGDFLADGSVPMTGQFRSIAGTAAAPGMTFVGDTDNGIFAPAADNISLTTGGVEKMRMLANGYIGLGTSTPSYVLDVQSNTATRLLTTRNSNGLVTNLLMDVQNSSGAGGTSLAQMIKFRGETTTATGQDMSAIGTEWTDGADATRSANLTFSTVLNAGSLTERVRLTADGSLGIGTSSPSRLLQVAGAMKLTPTATPGTPTAGDIFVDSASSNALKYHNGSNWVSIGSGSGDFLANGSVPMTGQFRSIAGTAAVPGISFVGDTDNGIFAPAADNFAIGTSGSEKLRVLANGNVGLGTTAPSYKLDVNGTLRATTAQFGNLSGAGGYVNFGFDDGVSSGFHAMTDAYRPAGSYSSVRMGYMANGASDTQSAIGYSTDLAFYGVSSTAQRMTLTQAGSLGIGTTAPSRLLQVAGAIKITPTANPSTPTAGDIFVDSTSSNTLKYHNGSSWVSIGSGSGDFMANGSVPMTGNLRMNGNWLSNNGTNSGIFIRPDGYVGMGTSNPTQALEVRTVYPNSPSTIVVGNSLGGGSGAGSNIILTTTSAADASIVYGIPGANWYHGANSGVNSGNFMIGYTTGSAGPGAGDLVTLTKTGSLGIGTTSPSRLLQVAGAMKITPTANPGTPTAGDIFVDSTSSNTLKYHNGSSWVSIGSGSGDFLADGSVPMTGQFRSIAGTTAAPGMSFVGDTNTGFSLPAIDAVGVSTAGVERVRFLANGNVGIGSTGAPQFLTISKNEASSALVSVTNKNASGYSGIMFNDNADVWQAGIGYGNASAASFASSLYLNSANSNPITFGVSNSERMRLTASGLGIGTTAPTRLLQVAGAMKITPTATPSTPTAGDIFVDSTSSNTLKYHNGSAWVSIGSGSGDFMANGSVPMTGQFRSIAGTAAAPGVSFVGDTDNGIFAPVADNFAISTSGSEKFRILANGNVGIGSTSPANRLQIETTTAFNRVQIASTTGGSQLSQLSIGGFNSFIQSFAETGTTVVANNDYLGSWEVEGYDGGNYRSASAIRTEVDGVPAASSMPGRITFATTPSGSITPTEKMRIQANGNIGIGMTSPTRLLQVAGAMKITPTATPSTPTAGDIFVDSASSNTLKYHNGSSWVSIGSGSGDFMANGSLPMTGQFRSVLGTQVAPGFSFVGDTNTGVFSPAADTYAITTNGAERLRVTSSGNVGIGLTNPAYPLTVEGHAYITGNIGTDNFKMVPSQGTINNTGGMRFNIDSDNNESGLVFSVGTGSENQPFQTAGELFRVQENGNVGIGLTAPTRLLQVAGAMKITPTANPGTPTAGDIFVDASSSNALKYHNGSSWVSIGSGSGDFMANGSVPMTGQFRSIAGTATAPGLSFVGDTDNGIFAPIADNFSIATSGVERMRVLANGSIGIGTTNPAFALDINGTLRSNVYRGGTSYGTSPAYIGPTGANSFTGLSFPGVEQVAISTGNSSANVRLLVDSNGNVGIGVTSPTRLLQVAGAMKITPTANPGTPTAGDMFIDSTASNALKYHNGSAWVSLAGGGTGDFMANGSLPMTGQFRSMTGGTAAAPGITFSGDTANGIFAPVANNLAIGTSGIERMRILANGYVGIGTSNPSFQFQVNSTTGSQMAAPAFIKTLNLYTTATPAVGRGSGLYFSGAGLSNDNGAISVSYEDAAGADAAMKFDTRAGNSSNERMRLTSAGYLGIGLSTPTRLFQVAGAMKITPTANPGTPTAGDMFIDSTASNALKYHNGSAWVSLAGGGTGDFMANGSLPMTGQFRSVLGSATAPGMSFVGDTNTGVYSPGADTVAIGTSGVERIRIANNGVGINTAPIDASVFSTLQARTDTATGWTTSNVFRTSLTPATTSAAQLSAAYFENTAQGSQAMSQIMGAIFDTTMSGSNTLDQAIGAASVNFQNSGTITNAVGFLAYPEQTTGLMDYYIAYQASTGNRGGTVNNSYGLYIEDMAAGTTSYGIYQKAGTDENFFAGNVGIGVTVPVRKLQTSGAIRINPTANPGGGSAGDLYFDSTASNVMKYHNGSAWVTVGGGGDFMANGSVPMTGQFRSIAGTQAAPGMSFAGDTNTGVYNPVADAVAITTAGTEAMRLLANGNVGIGMSVPKAMLQIAKASNPTTVSTANEYLHLGGGEQVANDYRLIGFGLSTAETQSAAYMGFKHTSVTGSGNGALVFGTRNVTSDTAPTERMRIDAAGFVGIGMTNPSVALDVNGDIEYTGTITDVSDRRLKENITPIDDSLAMIRDLPVYSYTMKGDEKKRLEYGVMAQDLRALVPNLTSVIDQEKGYIGVNYIGLIPWSIRAIQQVDREVASVKAENQVLKSRLDKLEEQNKILADQVQKLIDLHNQAK